MSRFFVEAPDTRTPQSSRSDSASGNVPTQSPSPDASTSRTPTSVAPQRPPRAQDFVKMSDKSRSSNSTQRKTPASTNRRDDATENGTQTGQVREMTRTCEKEIDETVSDMVSKTEGVSKTTRSPESRNKGGVGWSPPVAPKPRSKNGAKPPNYTSAKSPLLPNAKRTSPSCTLGSHNDSVQSKDGCVGSQSNVYISVTSAADGVYESPIVLRRKPDSKNTIAELIGPATSSLVFGKVSAGVEPSRKSVMGSPKLVRSFVMVHGVVYVGTFWECLEHF